MRLKMMMVKNIFLSSVNVATWRRFVFRYVVVLFFVSMSTACMRMPQAADDFSMLGGDVFSNLIRDSYSEVNLTPGHSSGSLGVGRLDKAKARALAINIFSQKTSDEVISLFVKNGGQCEFLNKTEMLSCVASRKWKLKNIGAPFDTIYWSDPSVKLEFTFSFKEKKQIQELILNIIDVTVIKEIRG